MLEGKTDEEEFVILLSILDMSQYSCNAIDCPRRCRVLCYCCEQNFCLEHLNTHQDAYLSQLHQLTDEINLLSESVRGRRRQQLDRWCHEAHQTIDRYYQQKCEELERETIGNEHRRVIECLQLKVAQMIREQNITTEQINSLQAATNAVRRELKQTVHEDDQYEIPPLKLDDEHFQPRKISWNLLSTIESVIRRKNFTKNNCIVIATDGKYFLMGEESNLCLLDDHLAIIKQISWTYGSIWDMCMSNTWKKFMIVAENGFFTFDEQTMVIEPIITGTKQEKSWYSCACSDESLFLATRQCNSKISEYHFSENSLTYKRKHRCCSNEDYIEHMKSSKDSLMLIIFNSLIGERRAELRSTITIDRLWTISLNISDKINIVSCCSLNDKGWLIVDLVQARLIHITHQGQTRQSVIYQPAPQYAVHFQENILAILTEEGIYLHRMN